MIRVDSAGGSILVPVSMRPRISEVTLGLSGFPASGSRGPGLGLRPSEASGGARGLIIFPRSRMTTRMSRSLRKRRAAKSFELPLIRPRTARSLQQIATCLATRCSSDLSVRLFGFLLNPSTSRGSEGDIKGLGSSSFAGTDSLVGPFVRRAVFYQVGSLVIAGLDTR